MAQTHNPTREAWNIAAVNRSYVIGPDGLPEIRSGGLIVSLPPMPGFDLLPASHHGAVFQMAAQFFANRVLQNAEGDASKTVADTMASGSIAKATAGNNAPESCYRSFIAERVKKQKADASIALIDAMVEKYRANTDRPELAFDTVVNAARDAAKNVPTTAKKPRSTKAVDTSMDLAAE